MSYPKTGNEVYLGFHISNTMFTGLGKGTITREDVSADYLRNLFNKYGVIVSCKPNKKKIIDMINERYGLELEFPESRKGFQVSEKHRRIVVINVQGLRRENGSLLDSYTDEELNEATFSFVKYYVQTEHYDDLVKKIEFLEKELKAEIEWRDRVNEI